MPPSTHSRVEALVSGFYMLRLKVDSTEAIESFLAALHNFIGQYMATEPLYLILDASSLDMAYTPRTRERIDKLISQIHQYNKTICMALVLPHAIGTCTIFLNNMLRHRETPQIRHSCFARREDAEVWLQNLQFRESLPAAQGF